MDCMPCSSTRISSKVGLSEVRGEGGEGLGRSGVRGRRKEGRGEEGRKRAGGTFAGGSNYSYGKVNWILPGF